MKLLSLINDFIYIKTPISSVVYYDSLTIQNILMGQSDSFLNMNNELGSLDDRIHHIRVDFNPVPYVVVR